MIRKYVRQRQPDFVTPPHPTHHAAQSSTRTARTQALADAFQLQTSYGSGSTGRKNSYKITRRSYEKSASADTKPSTPLVPSCAWHSPMPSTPRNSSLSSFSPIPAIRSLRYACVSYDADTTMLLMLRSSDTNRSSPDTKSVACPYLSVAPIRPTSLPSTTTKSANPVPPPKSSPVRLIRQLRPRYHHATNATPPDTGKVASATKTVARPIWRATVPHPDSRPIQPNQRGETRTPSKRFSSASTAGPFSRVSRRTVGDDVYCDEPHL